MSETMNINVEFRDRHVLLEVCARLGIEARDGEFKLYRTTERGLGVFLPGWKYPAVVKNNGTISFDNYDGRWGENKELNKLKQIYGVEFAKIAARKQGYSVYENMDENGEIKLTVQVDQ